MRGFFVNATGPNNLPINPAPAQSSDAVSLVTASPTQEASARPLADAYVIAARAGILSVRPQGTLVAQRRAFLDAIAEAVGDPERLIDVGAFASMQQLVHESVVREREALSATASRATFLAAPPSLTIQRDRAAIPVRANWGGDYEGAFLVDAANREAFGQELERMTGVKIELPADLAERIARGGGNVPMPELVEVSRAIMERLRHDPEVLARLESEPALKALHTQTLNHMKHATFGFEREGADYPHADVLASPCPFRPTLKGLLKAMDFERFVFGAAAAPVTDKEPDEAVEKAFKEAEQKVVNAMIADPHGHYCAMRDRLAAEGPNAKFEEHAGTVGYLIEKLKSDSELKQIAGGSQMVASFRAAVLADLERVQAAGLPHRTTVDAIERAIECFDIVQRAMHPEHSPELYHSGRYEYYIHYLSEESPEHINIPTIAATGSTDLLKMRGVPIGFWGVNTKIERVDGFYQTPYEFLMHDVNHDRRMYQFAREQAERLGIPVAEYYARCATFVKDKLLPLFVPAKDDDDATRKQKRLIKMVLFEVLHEDALSADPEVIIKAMLRAPKARTPFERIEDEARVVYFCEEGATTLAYVFRKLAHTFYDVPEDRKGFIVTEDLRTREAIVNAARTVFDALGATVSDEMLRYYVSTDEGLPDAFRHELDEDIYKRAGTFARGVIDGTSDEDKLAAAESLGNLALASGPYLAEADRTRMAALQRDAEGRLSAPLRQVLRARLHAIATGAVQPSAPTTGAPLDARLRGVGLDGGSKATIGSASVHMFVNDITLMPVDAVFVPQLQRRASVGGVGDLVWERGGDKGLRAFDKLAKEKGPLPHGFVQLAESGSSRWPYLLNTVTVRAAPDNQFETVFNSVVNALTLAGKAGLSSVAIPAVSTGIDGRLSYRQSARAILGAIDYLASAGVKIPDVVITLQDQAGYEAFDQVLRDNSYRLEGGTVRREPGEREFDVRRWAAGISRQMANQEDFDASAPV